MLAEVTRKVLNPHAQLKIFGDAWVLDIEAGILEGVGHRIVLAAPLPIANEPRKRAKGSLTGAEGLSCLGSSRLAAIGDHVGRHGCAQLSISLIDVLDGLLLLGF